LQQSRCAIKLPLLRIESARLLSPPVIATTCLLPLIVSATKCHLLLLKGVAAKPLATSTYSRAPLLPSWVTRLLS
jgi:hypothetical protein